MKYIKNWYPNISLTDWQDWNWQLKNRFTNLTNLAKLVPLNPEEEKYLISKQLSFPFALTPYYASLIDWENPQDPLRKQMIPTIDELKTTPKETTDPLNEIINSPLPGLIHNYKDRALLLLTNQCASYCRYCTRKRRVGKSSWHIDKQLFEKIVEYITEHREIKEIILSGGDPLLLNEKELQFILDGLYKIPNIMLIRIGTRLPVTLPFRITPKLVQLLGKYTPLWINTHFNHPNEITKEAAEACSLILHSGIPLNNQTVLLKGINDSVEIIKELNLKLLTIGVRPYYLLQCDLISGTAHFRTPLETGINIIKQLQGYISGLAIPTFIIDFKGSKIPLHPNNYKHKGNRWYLTNHHQEHRIYIEEASDVLE